MSSNVAPAKRPTVLLAIDCLEVMSRPTSRRAFFRARISVAAVVDLVNALEKCAQQGGREWYLLSWKTPNLKRLVLAHLDNRTPKYEKRARPTYLGNEIYRVTGRESSCNVHFTASVGAGLLAARLREVQGRAQEFVEIVVNIVSRKRARAFLEFVSDAELSASTSEDERLARTGEALAAEVLASEDFADWEPPNA